MNITILVDNPNSWAIPYAHELVPQLTENNHQVELVPRAEDIMEGDIVFFLSCERIVPTQILTRNKHNLVIHASNLPHGKGWSPLAWQILEGKNEIPITLFEAVEKVDSGPIYFQDVIRLQGHELNDEVKEMQGKKTVELALRFVNSYPAVLGRDQEGPESFYPRRTPKDSEADVDNSLRELFNQFRVADNKRYPIYFSHMGHKYILTITKARS